MPVDGQKLGGRSLRAPKNEWPPNFDSLRFINPFIITLRQLNCRSEHRPHQVLCPFRIPPALSAVVNLRAAIVDCQSSSPLSQP